MRELGASVSSGMSNGFSDSRIMWGSVANLVSCGVDKVAETASRVRDEVMRGGGQSIQGLSLVYIFNKTSENINPHIFSYTNFSYLLCYLF